MGKRWAWCALAVLPACGGSAGRAYFTDAGFEPLRDGGFAASDGSRPPEMEMDVRFEPPAVGASVLFATNSGAGRVAVIRAADYSIETVRVGADPLPAVAAPGRDLALSLDRGSSTVTLIRATADATTVRSLHVEHDVNDVAFDPTGRYAVLFEGPRPGLARRNFQDVSVLVLDEGAERLVRAVVSYGPSRVVFDAAGTRAIVVTEDGISQIDLTSLPAGEGPVRAATLGFQTLEEIGETQVTPDGSFAIARFGTSQLRQLDLRDGTVSLADLAQVAADGALEVTDVDIAPAGGEVLVVVRSHSIVVRIPIGAAFADSTGWEALDLTGQPVGSLAIAPSGTRAVSYTTDPSVEAIAILDLENGGGEVIGLRKSVRALAISPDGLFALALHHAVPRTDAPADADEEVLVDRSEGYSLIDLESGFARLALVDAAPSTDGFVLDSASGHLFLALRDDARSIRELQVVELTTFAVDRVPLIAPPTTVGVFDALDRAFIGQEADGGRVTFYLWGTGETHTVAGFELAARVRR